MSLSTSADSTDGCELGAVDGTELGCVFGATDGCELGAADSCWLGAPDGSELGCELGAPDIDGCELGLKVGAYVVMLVVIMLTEFDKVGRAEVSADDIDEFNPAVEVDNATGGSLVGAVPVNV